MFGVGYDETHITIVQVSDYFHIMFKALMLYWCYGNSLTTINLYIFFIELIDCKLKKNLYVSQFTIALKNMRIE